MKRIIIINGLQAAAPESASAVGKIALLLLPMTVLLSACGGGDDSPAQLAQSTPLLQIGQTRQYTGTTTRAVVYANPTGTQQDNTLEYTFVQSVSVLQAPSTAPADFDVQSSYAYTVVRDPGVGVVPISQMLDTYENLLSSGNSQQITQLGSKTVTVSNDETSDALGDGQYTQTNTTTATFPTARNNFPYPLQTGATMTTPQSENETIIFTDVNASDAPPPNGTNIGYTLTRTENDDGSYSYTQSNVNGTSFSRTQNSDGSGTETYTGATSSTDTTLGVPVESSGVYTIPVSVTVNAANIITTNYSAQDWYPNNALPSSPLVMETRNVVGPTSTLPADCSGAIMKPGMYEIDTSTNSLSPWGPTYTTNATRNFSAADGASICQLTTQTEMVYALDTGALVSTTTTTTSQILSAINY